MSVAMDAVNGFACSGCFIYFKKPHGYPVLCKHCWREWTPEQRKSAGVQAATEKEL